ncbi:MAG: uncharacterized protein KVP18_000104 [Porospora cf. gigantea A]|uniref:uncharacterized protein n=2 Tax=Porospora cf. gigantea A TaxID=2853593 RepID=UPI00355A0AAC|nr:MAG: hypothetical protein KVP18_000104 [Porospora cf. gigantea A]
MSQSRMEEDIMSMIQCKCHIGAKNLEKKMSQYVYDRNPEDGTHILHVAKIWEKLNLAARILVTIDNPQDICVVSQRPYGSRAVLKFAHYTGAQAIAGRWTPGTLTNSVTKNFVEPRVMVVVDPRIDSQAVKECFYAGVPVIALCNTDSPLKYVDVAIPCNNKSGHSIGLIFWMLARELLYLRGRLPRDQPWGEMPDLFFYKDPTEVEAKVGEGEMVDGVGEVEDWAAGGEEFPSKY